MTTMNGGYYCNSEHNCFSRNKDNTCGLDGKCIEAIKRDNKDVFEILLPAVPHSIEYYKTYQQRFGQKPKAKEFIAEIKTQSKARGLKVKTGILPSYRFSGLGKSEITDYYVRWYFFPPDTSWLNRFLYAPSL